jgi:hypothetical protein
MEVIIRELSMLNYYMDNSKKRNCLYHCFLFGEHAMLGQCNLIRIPKCIVVFIHSLCPDKNINCTGFCGINEVDNEAPRDSFESILPDVQGGNINFETGE